MRTRFTSSRVLTILTLSLAAFLLISADGDAKQKGLNSDALAELSTAGVDKYLGMASVSVVEDDIGGGWTRHTFDPEYDQTGTPNGPACIAGTPYSVLTKAGDPDKLLIFLQGGGACWQNFYQCNIAAEAQNGPRPPFGVFDSSDPDNPFADYSIVYMPYCDGSAFGGDNDVLDGSFPFGPVRFHRGVQNLSAGMDVAGATFPLVKKMKITVMGHSAGGVGVAAFAPFLTRFVYGNGPDLTVFNDAGPIAVNLGSPPAPFCNFNPLDFSCLSVLARASDWNFAQFYPQSCILDGRCNPFGQQTGIIDWRLDNDSTIREAFYETDADGTNRFFAQGDGTRMDPLVYRDLILTEHGALHDAHKKRYKRFIVSGDNTHGGVQGTAGSRDDANNDCFPPRPDLFYTQEANGVLLNEWTREFVLNGDGGSQFGWKDIVEDYVEVDCPLQP
jgi:hypothetical protein